MRKAKKNTTKIGRSVATVPERLANLGAIYADRSKVYGDNYKHFGKVMKGIFPRGAKFETEEEWARLGIFIQAVSKLTRYGQSFANGHPDSLDDASVYCQMLQELDYDIFCGKALA